MSLWLDVKYANLIGSRFNLFKVKRSNPYVANFRCYICGDSQKNKFKTRGYFFTKGQNVLFSCHNCGASRALPGVLQDVDLQLFNEYKLESIANKQREVAAVDTLTQYRPTFSYSDVLKSLKKISLLSHDHPAKRYVEKRKIPTDKHYKLYYTPRFNKWVNSLIPDKMDEDLDEPRLVLPFIDPVQRVYGFQGRAFHNKSIRYITIMLDESKPKIFGWEGIEHDRMVNVVEGPIDSLFLDNCVAMAGSHGHNNVDLVETDCSKIRMIYDNEPRNKAIVKEMDMSIEKGYNVFIWPQSITTKDINEFVIGSEISKPLLMRFVEANTYHGLQAKARLSQWSKC